MNGLSTDLTTLLPDLVLAVGAMALLMFGAFRGERAATLTTWLAVIVLVAVGYLLIATGAPKAAAFHGAFIVDGFARFAGILVLLGSVLALLMSNRYLEDLRIARFEYPVLILLATLGMLLMVSANSFIALYMGLELQSLALYVLAAFHRDSQRSTEAGLKYFVLGALSSGMMLYGISLIYGFTGTTGFTAVAQVVHTSGAGIGVIFGIVFLISGLAFKVSAVPFHMWTPDVYEGAPTPITALFSMAPKAAAMALFLRAILTSFPSVTPQWQQIVWAVSVLSMFLGAFAAIGQTNIKRFMAYSSIANMGYVLIGLAAGSAQGVQGALIYLLIYVVTNAGAFGVILAMRHSGGMAEDIADLSGLARSRPGLAFVFAAMMLSLAGIPPLAGFFAKFYVFLAAINAHLYVLAVLGVLASVIGAYYYLRIVKIMYFDEPAPAFDEQLTMSLNAILVGSSLFTLFFIVGAAPLVAMAGAAAKTLLP
jgi:NADH-quinone oxidoreductase subunit N